MDGSGKGLITEGLRPYYIKGVDYPKRGEAEK